MPDTVSRVGDVVTAWPVEPVTWIRIGTQRAIPAQFWTRTTFRGYTVSVLAAVGHRGPAALTVVVEQPRGEDGDPVTMNVLRTVTVDRIIRDGLGKLSRAPLDAEAETGIPGAFRVEEGGEVYVQETPGPGRGRRTTGERLERVAEIYLAALAEGRPPVNAVAQELPASRSTAGRLVGQARRAGLLTPTTRGRFSSLGEFRRFVTEAQREGGEVRFVPPPPAEREPEPELPPRTVNFQTGEVRTHPPKDDSEGHGGESGVAERRHD
jgi:hypothetical protein